MQGQVVWSAAISNGRVPLLALPPPPSPSAPFISTVSSSRISHSLKFRGTANLKRISRCIRPQASNVGIGSSSYDERGENDEQKTFDPLNESSLPLEKPPNQIPYPLSIRTCSDPDSLISLSNKTGGHEQKKSNRTEKLQDKSGLRINLQLGSHKRFASAFTAYAELADSAKLYSTNAIGGPPQLIAWKSGTSKLLVEPEEFKLVKLLSNLNNDAESIYELYKGDPNPLYEPGSAWKDIVMLPSRPDIQLQLKTAIEKLEAHKEQCIHPSSN